MEWLQLACMILAALAAVFAMAAWISSRRQNISGDDLEKVRQDLLAEIRATRRELALSVDRSLSAVQESQGIGLRQTAEMQDLSLRQMTQQLGVRQENLQKTLAELFDFSIPFKQCLNPEPCTYCDFKELCRR